MKTNLDEAEEEDKKKQIMTVTICRSLSSHTENTSGPWAQKVIFIFVSTYLEVIEMMSYESVKVKV